MIYHGTNVAGATQLSEAFEQAGLDWKVELGAVQGVTQDGTRLDLPKHRVTYRSDNNLPLGVVGDKYHVFQNADNFDWLQALCDEGELKLSHAAEYRGGRKVAITAELPTKTVVGADDSITRYLVAVNSHDGGGAVRLFPTTRRAVCDNLLRPQEREASRNNTIFRMIHRESSLADRVKRGREFLSEIKVLHDGFERVANQLQQVTLSDEQIRAYFTTLADLKTQSTRSSERLQNSFWETFANEKNAGMMGRTAWAAVNTITEVSDHQGRTRSGEQRMRSNLFGGGDKFKSRAFKLATDLFITA